MGRRFSRAVVTGGAGFLGSLVCRRLLEQGTAVVCLDNLLTGMGAVPAMDGPPLEFQLGRHRALRRGRAGAVPAADDGVR